VESRRVVKKRSEMVGHFRSGSKVELSALEKLEEPRMSCEGVRIVSDPVLSSPSDQRLKGGLVATPVKPAPSNVLNALRLGQIEPNEGCGRG
jgi:hypothetical protein